MIEVVSGKNVKAEMLFNWRILASTFKDNKSDETLCVKTHLHIR